MDNEKSKIIIYRNEDGSSNVDIKLENETMWLTQKGIAELFSCTKDNISLHLKNIYAEGELDKNSTTEKYSTVQKEGNRMVNRTLVFYNLDAIIAVGYRVNSKQATTFRIWASNILKEYIKKGFVLDDERLKGSGGGSYWKDLLNRIRDIRSSEKVMYRQVLDLYSTSIDYDAKSQESIKFFQIVQNKLHYATHKHTAPELIFERADSDKPFMGLMSFKGSHPLLDDIKIAKNYLDENELKILNNIVSAYFDLAELSAIEHKPMYMKDYIDKLDLILKANDRPILNNAGTISRKVADKKAIEEYKKYQVKTLSPVENDYINTIKEIESIAKKKSK